MEESEPDIINNQLTSSAADAENLDNLAAQATGTTTTITATNPSVVGASADDRPGSSASGNQVESSPSSRQSLRKRRFRARHSSSSSSESSPARIDPPTDASQHEEHDDDDGHDDVDMSDLIDTSDSDSTVDAHEDISDTMSSDGNRLGAADPSLAWAEKLCGPANTHKFRCLKWLNNRAVGSKPNIADSCWSSRMQVQGSAWMVGRWKLFHRLNQHDGCVNAVNFNESGSLIASGSDDLNIIIWEWARRRVVSRFDSGHSANVFQSKFLPHSSDLHVVSCARDGQVRLAQLSSSGECRNTRRLGMHRGSAHKLSLDVSCPHAFYSCGEDASVYLFDVRESHPTKLFTTKERQSKVPLYSIHSNPTDGYEFLTSGRDQYIRVYDRRYCSAPTGGGSDRPSKKFCPPHLNRDSLKHVTCAAFSNDGKKLIGSYNDDDIYLFETSQMDGTDAIQRFRGHRNCATIKGVNFYGPNSEFVVSGSDCGNVFVWETDSANIVNMFHADDGGVVNVLEPHPHDPILATSGLDHDVKIWTPSLDFPVTPSDLSEKVGKSARQNAARRKAANAYDGDGPLPSIAWILMEALQRERRRHLRAHLAARGENDDDDESEEDSDDSDDSDMDSDDDDDVEHEDDDENDEAGSRPRGRRPISIQCAQS